MTINQFLNSMKPVDDIDYKICLVDFMIGSMVCVKLTVGSNIVLPVG